MPLRDRMRCVCGLLKAFYSIQEFHPRRLGTRLYQKYYDCLFLAIHCLLKNMKHDLNIIFLPANVNFIMIACYYFGHVRNDVLPQDMVLEFCYQTTQTAHKLPRILNILPLFECVRATNTFLFIFFPYLFFKICDLFLNESYSIYTFV